MIDDINPLIDKILETIRRDVGNIYFKQVGNTKVLEPEHQDALVKYYKLLADARLAAKERELEDKLARAEEALSRTAPKGP